MQAGHAWYKGRVGHKRYLPEVHDFGYDVSYLWLDLQQLDSLSSFGRYLSLEKFAAWSFRRKDYLQGADDLAQAVKDKVKALGGDKEVQLVFLLSPLANFNVFFSPLNLYYCYADGKPLYLLAEVSNTPWNERHYYLIPLQTEGDTEFCHDKNFHVSPFNPLDMQYQWKINQPETELQLSISNWRLGERVFSAWLDLTRHELNKPSLQQQLIHTPWQNVQVVFRIYWHALKLLFKRLPVYGHQQPKDPSL
ncbi:DUF1365 domain-containing protein [Rheinheimera sp.]|uniref:DUF1365 domain-containing protein n=1 Tax=Rheinheimera sp. TaxID=1869214 RepID=UPI0027BAFFEE|nr:DUF1365 domain-containing protein [Rheinheimera sp.]